MHSVGVLLFVINYAAVAQLVEHPDFHREGRMGESLLPLRILSAFFIAASFLYQDNLFQYICTWLHRLYVLAL